MLDVIRKLCWYNFIVTKKKKNLPFVLSSIEKDKYIIEYSLFFEIPYI